ncbi:MAG: hypothetical protein JWM11_2918 [Planctomycetaceae bacterium]|nr:hypothetical protein [Planctomycetaceae bacterium]
MFNRLTSDTAFIRPFPRYEDVFTDNLELHRKHFLPLVSVDMSFVFDDLDFWLHFVTPIEPLLEGNVGDHTDEYFDFYNSVGQVAFKVTDGKYSFNGDFNFFTYESGTIFKVWPQQADAIHQDYRDRLASYEQTRNNFLKYGGIPYSAAQQLESENDYFAPFVGELGGEVPFGNWGDQIPRNRKGNPFQYIGEVTGFSYCDRTADGILLFYDPDEQIALLIFDWS